jgi:hypothetical protein
MLIADFRLLTETLREENDQDCRVGGLNTVKSCLFDSLAVFADPPENLPESKFRPRQ